MDEKISTGSEVFDWLLDGGIEKEVITTIYGPAGSGKSNFCILTVANFPKDKKIVYIDTEGSFSITRLKQVSKNYESIMDRMVFLKPTNFEEQKTYFEKLKELVDDDIGLIVFDSVAMLYRLEIGKNKDVYSINKELGIQLSYLSEIARKKHIPVLVTNQVYSDFEDRDKVNLVGGDILKYTSKCLIELKKADSLRKAILRKHRSLPDKRAITFKIINEGVERVKKNNKTIPQ